MERNGSDSDAGTFGSLEGLTEVDGQEQIARIGLDLVNRLFVLMRNTLLFDLNNEALERPVQQFLESLRELDDHNEQKAAIGVLDDNLSLNKQILKPDSATFNNSRFVGRIFKKLEAMEFQFDAQLSEEDLRGFMAALRRAIEKHEGAAVLSDLTGFKLVPMTMASAGGEDVEIDSRIQVLRVFAGAISVVTRAMTLAAHGLHWKPSLVRRAAYDLADSANQEPDLLLGLLLLPVQEGRLGTHLVRTAILSILCTKKVGLRRKAWTEAALIGLCHHLSRPEEKSYLEEEDLTFDKEESVEPVDPLDAALVLCSRGGLNEDLIRRVVGVYEATGSYSQRGDLYREAEPTDLLGRIVSLADRYATLLESLQPDEALRLLMSERQEKEPELVRAFVSSVGLYPVGTMVQLESGARAIVVEAPRHRQQLLRPVVQLVDGEGGLIDLSQGDHDHGQIASTLHAAEQGVNISHFFLL